MERLDAIILAGGRGTRLKNVISDIPKPLAPVNNRPFLDIILSFIDKCDMVDNVILAIGYMSDKIMDMYSECDDYGFDILFSVEKELLGTGGGIKKALSLSGSEDVIVLNGDSFIDIDISDLVDSHAKRSADMTIVLKEVEDAKRFGTVKVNDNNRIISFEEKKEGSDKGLINAGIYIFDREMFDDVEEEMAVSLEKELLPEFIKKEAYGYISRGKFIDIGIPETYKLAEKYLYGPL